MFAVLNKKKLFQCLCWILYFQLKVTLKSICCPHNDTKNHTSCKHVSVCTLHPFDFCLSEQCSRAVLVIFDH